MQCECVQEYEVELNKRTTARANDMTYAIRAYNLGILSRVVLLF